MNREQKEDNLSKHETKLSEWRERIEECQNSGMSIKMWCRENGINRKTFYEWKNLIYEYDQKNIQADIQIVEVPRMVMAPTKKEAEIIIQNSGWRIEVQNEADPELISQIMQTVAQYV